MKRNEFLIKIFKEKESDHITSQRAVIYTVSLPFSHTLWWGLPSLILSWTHWLFDLKPNSCHSMSFQLSSPWFIFSKKCKQVVAFSLNHQSSSQNLFVPWVWSPLPYVGRFSIFNKHFYMYLSLYALFGVPMLLQTSYFPQQMCSWKVYTETCFWNLNPFRTYRESLPIKRLLATFWEVWGITHFFSSRRLSKTGLVENKLCLFSDIFDGFHPLSVSTWHHWPFTKWSDFFHNKRNCCNEQGLWLSAFE